MDTLAKYKFADWLYNRFVEKYKNQNVVEAFIFLDILSRYQLFAQEIRKLSDQRRHIKELHRTITKALKEGTAHRLHLAGEEGTAEFNRAMSHSILKTTCGSFIILVCFLLTSKFCLSIYILFANSFTINLTHKLPRF